MEPRAHPLAGKIVSLPKEVKSRAEEKQLFVKVRQSEVRNARAYNSQKKYTKGLRAIFNGAQ